MSASRLWLVLAVLYAAFFSWYTSFSGPLSADEIEGYLAALEERAPEPGRLAVWKQFMEGDTGDDFAMLNAIEMRATPLPVPGVPAGESSAEVLARYTTPFFRSVVPSAAHPVFFGSAAAGSLDLWGIEGAEHWSAGGLVRYRSRRDLMEQVTGPALAGDIHQFKIAAMEKTIAFPVDPWFHLGDPRLVLGLVLAVLGLAWNVRCARRRPSP